MGIGTAIAALREKLIADINGSGLPPVVVELVVQPIMAELHSMALGQVQHEKEQTAREEKGEEHAECELDNG